MDLALADDAAIAELIPGVVGHCEKAPQRWSRWAPGMEGGEPFPPARTLAEMGVVDGCELVLRDTIDDAGAEGGSARSGPGAPNPAPAVEAAHDESRGALRRQLLIDLVERTVDDIAKIRGGGNPLLDYASPRARAKLRGLIPPPLHQPVARELSDLAVCVRWSAAPGSPVTAVATLTELWAPGDTRPALPGGSGGVSYGLTLQLSTDSGCRRLLDVEMVAQPIA